MLIYIWVTEDWRKNCLPCQQTCNPSSTCQESSHNLGDQPATQGPWSTCPKTQIRKEELTCFHRQEERSRRINQYLFRMQLFTFGIYPNKGSNKNIPGGNTHIVLFARMVKLCKSPINQPQLPLFMVDHHIVRLHISVHDPLRMTVVHSL